MIKHTPGPWSLPHFATDSACKCRWVLSDYYGGSICEINVGNELPMGEGGEGGDDSPPLEEAKANAKLISMAPNMLHLLEMLQALDGLHLAQCPQYALSDDDRKQIDVVIATAKGIEQ